MQQIPSSVTRGSGRAVASHLLLTLFCLGFAFLLWKGAFVRYRPGGRLLMFCGTLPVAMLWTWPIGERSFRRLVARSLLLVTAVAICIALPSIEGRKDTSGSWLIGRCKRISRSLSWPLSLTGRRRQLDAKLAAERKRCSLPKIKATVGSEPIDLLSASKQSVVLLNGMHYRPRPVFQSYSAYTPDLLALNASYFRGSSAPPYLLLKVGSSDDRYPTLDDSLALLEVLQSYRPVLFEQGYTLLRREQTASHRRPVRPCLQQEVRWGEPIDLRPYRGKILWASFTIESSALGRLAELAFRPPPVYIKADGYDWKKWYRLVPGICQTGFLLQPKLEGDADWIRVLSYEQRYRRREYQLASFSLELADPANEKYFKTPIKVELVEIPAENLISFRVRENGKRRAAGAGQ